MTPFWAMSGSVSSTGTDVMSGLDFRASAAVDNPEARDGADVVVGSAYGAVEPRVTDLMVEKDQGPHLAQRPGTADGPFVRDRSFIRTLGIALQAPVNNPNPCAAGRHRADFLACGIVERLPF
jgi:hypothetical protein